DATVLFPFTIFYIQRKLMIHDGFSVGQRLKMMAKGMVWLFKPGGLLQPMYKHYFTYYKPGYHPWQESEQPGYEQWLAAFNSTRDPVQASEMTRVALAQAA